MATTWSIIKHYLIWIQCGMGAELEWRTSFFPFPFWSCSVVMTMTAEWSICRSPMCLHSPGKYLLCKLIGRYENKGMEKSEKNGSISSITCCTIISRDWYFVTEAIDNNSENFRFILCFGEGDIRLINKRNWIQTRPKGPFIPPIELWKKSCQKNRLNHHHDNLIIRIERTLSLGNVNCLHALQARLALKPWDADATEHVIQIGFLLFFVIFNKHTYFQLANWIDLDPEARWRFQSSLTIYDSI